MHASTNTALETAAVLTDLLCWSQNLPAYAGIVPKVGPQLFTSSTHRVHLLTRSTLKQRR
jgi:hypothetical protein